MKDELKARLLEQIALEQEISKRLMAILNATQTTELTYPSLDFFDNTTKCDKLTELPSFLQQHQQH